MVEQPPVSNPPKPDASKALIANHVKPITVLLAYGIRQYRVTSVTNTTILKPGMWLSEEYVTELCVHPDWTVTMADDQIVGQLMGLALGALPVPKL